MIKAKDLMLGNLVEYKSDYYRVAVIGNNYKVGVTKDGCNIFVKDDLDLNPIDLDDDILGKISGEKDTNHWHFGDISINRYGNGLAACFCNESIGKISYLHELQNLYKNLMKEELEVLL